MNETEGVERVVDGKPCTAPASMTDDEIRAVRLERAEGESRWYGEELLAFAESIRASAISAGEDVPDDVRDQTLEDAEVYEAFYWAVQRGERQPSFLEWARFRMERELAESPRD
jgi:hypothetical protein